MTTPPEEVSIVCPECHATYQSWTRRSMNLGLDHFSKKYIREIRKTRVKNRRGGFGMKPRGAPS